MFKLIENGDTIYFNRKTSTTLIIDANDNLKTFFEATTNTR